MVTTATEQEIIKKGNPHPPDDPYVYQYTSSNVPEAVQGLIAQVGSSAYQAKLFAGTAGVKPLGVFDVQTGQGIHTPMVSGVRNSAYAEPGYPCKLQEWGVFIFKATVVSGAGNSITKGMRLEGAAGGKLTRWSTGYPIAVAMEAIDASSGDAVGKVLWLGPAQTSERIVAENLIFTIETTTAQLAVYPLVSIDMLEKVYAATFASNALKWIQTNNPSTGEVKVALSTGVCTVLATDGITNIGIRYRVRD